MDNRIKGKILQTLGWTAIGIGCYLVYKGSEIETTIDITDYIDAEFEIIE